MKLNDLEKKFIHKEMLRTKAAKERMVGYQKKRRTENSKKHIARITASSLVKSGKIKKEPCAECGEIVVEAHHTDYDFPLQITWLCKKHHLSVHGKKLHNYSVLGEKRLEELRKLTATRALSSSIGLNRKPGRPFLGDEKKKGITLTLPKDVLAWMKKQSESRPKMIERWARAEMGEK